MGNVRNPVGPLPSSIYWRRRAIVACLLAIGAAAIVWAVTSGGGGGSGSGSTGAQGAGTHGRTPLPSITPGPTSSQTGITTEPGGRSVGGASDGGPTGSAGTDAGSTGSAGSADAGATSGGSGSGGGSGGGAGGQRLPVGTSVPDCGGSRVHLALHSVKNSYEPGEKPTFQISAANSGGSACKVNFSAVSAVVTIVDSGNHHVWASDDCPASRSPYLLEVPASASATYDVPWSLAVSAPQCATPSGTRTASSGTYLAKVTVPGFSSAQASFVLSAV